MIPLLHSTFSIHADHALVTSTINYSAIVRQGIGLTNGEAWRKACDALD